MSWSIEERIGECRPFPAQVVVYRGETDECLAYVSGEVADRLKAENAKLLKELEAEHALAEQLGHYHEDAKVENGRLRERITTQGQTIQAYRDESREWREAAEHAQAENEQLRALVEDMWPFVKSVDGCPNRECCLFEECDASSERECPIDEHMAARMRDLGVEVDECQ